MLIGRAPLAIACHPDRPYKTFAEAWPTPSKRPGQGQHRRAVRQPGAAADDLHQEGERLRPQPDLLQGRRADRCRTSWPASPTCAITTLASVEPAHRRQQAARRSPPPARSAPPALPDTPTLDRAGHQGLSRPIRGGASMRRPACRGRSSTRMHAEITKAVRSPDVTQKFVEQIQHGNPAPARPRSSPPSRRASRSAGSRSSRTTTSRQQTENEQDKDENSGRLENVRTASPRRDGRQPRRVSWRTRHRPRKRGRLAQGTDQDHRALPARRLDRSGGAHHPGQADREHRLEHHRSTTSRAAPAWSARRSPPSRRPTARPG